ncbi:putative Zn finger protein [Saccharothrix tamanrassetensis]|uniref:Putative Zn finger protein n=1 Tax=Saccharothrix tamanrassetensis TaxID=1051531 RepID=A0A841C9C0_9PSEU|nr:SWIM zinc finger family protein [Saccharothrix tamanrassetensis]MBB5953550.1 putative Zn finger protein [Saccharothrix tamanrassetensis]
MSGRVKGFPAFGKGVRRARSWWGRAWLQAVEDTSLDQAPLRQGRKYAHAGLVGTITVSPGRLSAAVYDTEDTYQTTVRLAPFTDAEWHRFLGQIAAKAGHLAALLDREMPRELADAAADAGLGLLPGIGDLDPECTCPGWELPCRHAAALCHQASWLLDADPWVLLLLRGRDQDEVVAGARPSTGVLAVDAYARQPADLPDDPPLADLGPLPEFEPAPGLDVEVLALLVADAAGKARELLLTGERPVLDERRDRIRMAAALPVLADRLDAHPRELDAWRQGGPAGLDVLDEAWTPAKADAARARAAWEGGELPAAKTWRNRWTVRDRQLRYGRDGRWYPYRSRAGEWHPTGTADRDPAAAFSELT